MRRLPPLNALRAFEAAARHLSFSRAADELAVTPGAISQQMRILEDWIGVPLFNRHARGLILTEQGEILFGATQGSTGTLEQVHDELTAFKGTPQGPLRVTTTVGLGSAWLAIRLHEFLARYPDMHVELMLENNELDLGMRQADCAIRLQQPQQPDIIQRKLFTVHFHVYAAPNYLEAHGTPQSVEELDNHRLVAWGDGTPAYLGDLNWILSAGMPHGKLRTPSLKINSILAIQRACTRGAGIALLPDYAVGVNSPLVKIMEDVEIPSFDTYFAYSSELRGSARLEAFRDFLLEKAKEWRF